MQIQWSTVRQRSKAAARFLVLVSALAVVLVAVPGSAAHPNEFELRLRVSLGLEPGLPGPSPPAAPRASSKGGVTVGHANPGGGFNADVVAHKGYSHLGSWGTSLDEETYVNGTFCPSRGVRVYSLFNLAQPALVATFAAVALVVVATVQEKSR